MTHACYLLRSLNPRFKSSFYIGCTTDPRRRIRQHNGEMAQGAQFTKKKRPWEMILCVYGFTSHVNALQFEWAWQHPLISLAVKEAAAKLPSTKGIPGMIKLVCTMVTLPKWNSLNLTLQFMISSLLQHRQGSPPLPPQMRLFVAPFQSLPAKDTGDNNDDDDDLITCPDDLSQSVLLDEDSGLNASSSFVKEQLRVSEGGFTAGLQTQDMRSSPCPKPKGKKSRKCKTPQGRTGKRGGNLKLSEDPILIDLHIKGSGSRTCYSGAEMSAVKRHELRDFTLYGDSRITTSRETICRSGGNQGGRMAFCRNPLDLSDLDSLESLEIGLHDCNVHGDSKLTTLETMCTIKENPLDLSYLDSLGSLELGLHDSRLHGDFGPTILQSKRNSSGTQGERMDCYRNPFDLSYLDSLRSSEIDSSVSGTSCTDVIANDTSQRVIREQRACVEDSLKKDVMRRSIRERIPLHETSKVQSNGGENRTSVMQSITNQVTSGSQSSHGQVTESYTESEDPSCWSDSETIFSNGAMKDHHPERRIISDVVSLCASKTPKAVAQVEFIGYSDGEEENGSYVDFAEEQNLSTNLEERGGHSYSYGVLKDMSCKSTIEIILSDGPLQDDSVKSITPSRLVRDGYSGAKSTNQESDAGDSDIEVISVEEFRTAGGRRKEIAAACIHGSIERFARGAVSSMPEQDRVHTIAGKENPPALRSVKGVEPQQKSLRAFFQVRKQVAAVPRSNYRKLRNGELCQVLQDHSSKTSNAPNEVVESKQRLPGMLPDSKDSSHRVRTRDLAVLIDSDDDEVQEISVTEFKQITLGGKRGATRKGSSCSLTHLR